jgi:hypothetical protein
VQTTAVNFISKRRRPGGSTALRPARLFANAGVGFATAFDGLSA